MLDIPDRDEPFRHTDRNTLTDRSAHAEPTRAGRGPREVSASAAFATKDWRFSGAQSIARSPDGIAVHLTERIADQLQAGAVGIAEVERGPVDVRVDRRRHRPAWP